MTVTVITNTILRYEKQSSLFFPVAFDGRLEDRIAVLWILERDSLYGTLNFLHQSNSFFHSHNTATAPTTQKTKLVR